MWTRSGQREGDDSVYEWLQGSVSHFKLISLLQVPRKPKWTNGVTRLGQSLGSHGSYSEPYWFPEEGWLPGGWKAGLKV